MLNDVNVSYDFNELTPVRHWLPVYRISTEQNPRSSNSTRGKWNLMIMLRIGLPDWKTIIIIYISSKYIYARIHQMAMGNETEDEKRENIQEIYHKIMWMMSTMVMMMIKIRRDTMMRMKTTSRVMVMMMIPPHKILNRMLSMYHLWTGNDEYNGKQAHTIDEPVGTWKYFTVL